MIFNNKEFKSLLDIVHFNHLIFIVTNIGVDILTDEELDFLKKYGLNEKDLIDVENNPLEQAYRFGVLSAAIGDKESEGLNYDDFLSYLNSGTFVPLSKEESYALEFIKNRAYSDIKNLENGIIRDFENIHLKTSEEIRAKYEEIIGDSAKKAILDRESLKQLTLEIGNKTGDWERNLDRISDYVLHQAYEEGRANYIEEEFGEDTYVYKTVYEGACAGCIRAYTTAGIGSEPRIFKIDELRANGTNIGRKLPDWLPVLGPMHPHCFPISDTEILTDEGWKYIDKIKGNEQCLTYNLEKNTCEWSNIKEKVQYNYEGDMYLWENGEFSLMSTPNHKQVVELREKGKSLKNQFKLVEGTKLPKVSRFLKSILNWKGEDKEVISICNHKFNSLEFCKFMGYYLSEGSISEKNNSKWLTITQNKDRYFEDILEISKRLFEVVNIWNGKGISKKIAIKISDENLLNWFKNFGLSYEKFIPSEIKNLDKKYLLVFLEKYINGDGSRKISKSWKKGLGETLEETISTTSYKMVADLSELILKVGKSCKISEHNPTRSIKKNGEIIQGRKKLYKLSINKTLFSQPEKQIIKNWKGEVGCVEVELNNTLFIKRKGSIKISGNCRCSLNFVPQGFVWNPKDRGFTKPIPYQRKVPRRSKVKIKIGDKEFYT